MIDLFVAVQTRWTQQGLPDYGPEVVQGGGEFGLWNDEPDKRTQRPYAVLRPVSEATTGRSNFSKWESQQFEVWVVANTDTQANLLVKRVVAALEYAPLTLDEGWALAVLAMNQRAQPEAQYYVLVQEFKAIVQKAVNRFPG